MPAVTPKFRGPMRPRRLFEEKQEKGPKKTVLKKKYQLGKRKQVTPQVDSIIIPNLVKVDRKKVVKAEVVGSTNGTLRSARPDIGTPLAQFQWSECFPKNISQNCQLLGYGGFGAVYKAFSKHFNKNFALKEFTLNNQKPGTMVLTTDPKEIEREFCLHKRLVHENIASLYGKYDVFQGTSKISSVFVMELCVGDLFKYINYQSKSIVPHKRFIFPRTLKRTQRYIQQLVSGIEYMHVVMKYIHMDLKPENVLVCANDTVKITDFGCSIRMKRLRQVHSSLKSYGGTLAYFPPEVAEPVGRPSFDSTMDVYAIGVITYQLIHPFGTHPVVRLKISQEERTEDTVIPGRFNQLRDVNFILYNVARGPMLQDFLYKTIGTERKDRPIITKLKEFPWLSHRRVTETEDQ